MNIEDEVLAFYDLDNEDWIVQPIDTSKYLCLTKMGINERLYDLYKMEYIDGTQMTELLYCNLTMKDGNLYQRKINLNLEV